MRLPRSLILLFFLHTAASAASPAKREYATHNYYVLEHDPQVASLAEIAEALGVEIIEQAGELLDHWLVRAKTPTTEGLAPRDGQSDHVMDAFEKFTAKALEVRSQPLASRSLDGELATQVSRSVKYLSRQIPRQRVKRAPPPIRPGDSSPARAVAQRLGIEDPLFPEQWHLVNDEFPEHMMNATPVWEMGFTGKGIISSLVDDGLDYDSEDLAANFDAANSYDFNDHVDLPTPKLSDDHHGTRCAGQVAAGKNAACGLGIAYESKVAGVRILSGPISDVDEAAALNYGYQNVSIYSCSWGPPDNGLSMEGPDYLIKKAVVNGINNGRGGKGSIFVFASGNGAAHNDQCNFDGYTNSIYSVTVSAIDYKGLHPYYSEPCAANMIVAYSSGSGRHIVTTDKGKNECSRSHGGTSAAAPNAVGVFALALEARPDLTWRDIQYLCVETARIVNEDDPDWERTATGRLYSYKYGFGALDAYRYVKAARDWNLVKPQAWLRTHAVQLNDGTLSKDGKYDGGEFIPQGGISSKVTITQEMLDAHNLETLEHINIRVWINHSKRGDIEAALISPNGIKSVLAAPRSADADKGGYPGWTFMTVKHWGEKILGDWTLHVSDQDNHDEHNGTFIGWNMIFWGTTIDPSRATKLEITRVDDSFPPIEEADPPIPTAASSTQHTKPTALLPTDHGIADGENTKSAFAGGSPTSTATPASISGTPDEGWFPGLSSLVSNQKWFFGAIGAVAIFGFGAAAFFWRRRVKQLKLAGYGSLSAGDDVGMSALGGQGATRGGPGGSGGGVTRTRELYDAFGEVSDDEDADEETGLTGAGGGGGRVGNVGLGFHSGFLEDDEPASAGPVPIYRDEPEPGTGSERPHGLSPDRPASPTVSGDGSWEHAS